MLRCKPFLLFDGNCAEALTFYHRCIGGELILTILGDTQMKDMFPKENQIAMVFSGYLKETRMTGHDKIHEV
jgi:PhnB protein